MLTDSICPKTSLPESRALFATPIIGELDAMSGENRRLVADEPVEFETTPIQVHDFREHTHTRRTNTLFTLAPKKGLDFYLSI